MRIKGRGLQELIFSPKPGRRDVLWKAGKSSQEGRDLLGGAGGQGPPVIFGVAR